MKKIVKIKIVRNLLFVVTLGISLSTMQIAGAMQGAGSVAASSSSSSDSSSSSSSFDSFSNSNSSFSSSSDALVGPEEFGKLKLSDVEGRAHASDESNEKFWQELKPLFTKLATLLDDKKMLKEITDIDIQKNFEQSLVKVTSRLIDKLQFYCKNFEHSSNQFRNKIQSFKVNNKDFSDASAQARCLNEINELLKQIVGNEFIADNAPLVQSFRTASVRAERLLGEHNKRLNFAQEIMPRSEGSASSNSLAAGDEKDDKKNIALSRRQASVSVSDNKSNGLFITLNVSKDDDVEAHIDRQLGTIAVIQVIYAEYKEYQQAKEKAFKTKLQPALQKLSTLFNDQKWLEEVAQLDVRKAGFDLQLYGFIQKLMDKMWHDFEALHTVSKVIKLGESDQATLDNALSEYVAFAEKGELLHQVAIHYQEYVNNCKNFIEKHRKNKELIRTFDDVEKLLKLHELLREVTTNTVTAAYDTLKFRAQILGIAGE